MGAKSIQHDGGTLSLAQACYHAAHDFPGKVAAVAAITGLNVRTLANKLNPNLNSHLLNADDVAAILAATKDGRIVAALCEPVGIAWHWMDEVRELPADLDVLGGGSAAIGAANEVLQEVVKALEDGQVDAAEARRIDAAVHEAQRQLLVLGQLAKRFMG